VFIIIMHSADVSGWFLIMHGTLPLAYQLMFFTYICVWSWAIAVSRSLSLLARSTVYCRDFLSLDLAFPAGLALCSRSRLICKCCFCSTGGFCSK